MTQTQSIAWKEWRETRIFLWIAFGVFVFLPMIGATEQYFVYGRKHFQYFSSDWVYYFGGVLAIFVAVGSACRDLNDRIEDFWRSRPVSEIRWMLVKYAMGLAIVLIACELPLLTELAVERDKDALTMAVWFPFLLTGIFSVSFAAGALLRRTAHAAMVSLAALLLVYYLPTVLPPLRWIDFPLLRETISDYDDWNLLLFSPAAFEFAAGMLVIALAGLGLALLGVRRDWRIESGQKLIYGSISLALLILFASAAYRLGTNLPLLQEISFPINFYAGEEVQGVYWKGDTGQLVTYKERNYNNATQEVSGIYKVRAMHITRWGIGLDNKAKEVPFSSYASEVLMPPQSPIMYYTDEFGGNIVLMIEDVTTKTSKAVAVLGPETRRESWTDTLVWNHRLYVRVARRLIVFDVSNPTEPQKISEQPFNYRYSGTDWDGDEEVIPLPDIADLMAQERLDFAFARDLRFPQSFVRDGDVVCSEHDGILREYRLTSLTPTLAKFSLVGQYKWTFLERYMYHGWQSQMKLSNGLLYFSQGSNYLSPHIVVFDTRGPKPLQMIGHFAVPTDDMLFTPMNDPARRIIVVGIGKIWLVGPPPHHD